MVVAEARMLTEQEMPIAGNFIRIINAAIESAHRRRNGLHHVSEVSIPFDCQNVSDGVKQAIREKYTLSLHDALPINRKSVV